MAGGMSHTIGVLVKGHNALTASLTSAEHSLTSFRKTAEATALSVNSSLVPGDIDMSAVEQAKSRLTGLGTKAMVAGGLIAGGLGLAVHTATGFNVAMAEVSTLVDTATTDMGALTSQVRSLSKEYGQMPVDTAGALYTTISAGYGDAADATVMLEGAMKLARGGITDTGTAIDGLTSIMNSYGMSADQVSGVSDQMFVSMKAGKTTIGELSGSLGKVTPLASAAGVGLDHLLSATSALTLGGLSTSEAVTSLRGMLSAVLKPTSEAQKMAASLGIEFSGAAVKSMGLAGWLAHVKEKTSGNQESMSKLFGSVEALSGVLALTGNQAGSFSSILEQMGNSTGATDEAFKKVNESAAAAFDRAKSNAAVLMETIGNALLPVVSGLADSFAWLSGKISIFAEAHPFLTKTVVVLAAVTAGVLLIGGAALIMGAQVMAAMTMVNVSTGGVLLAVGALITGITALVMWWTSGAEEMGESTGILTKVWDTLKSAFYAVAVPVAYGVGYLAGVITNAWTTVSAYTAEVWPMIETIIGGAWAAVTQLLFPQIAILKGLFTFAWESIKVVTGAAWAYLKMTITTVWTSIYNSIALVWNLVSGVFKAGLQLLTGDWSGAWQTIQTTFENVWANIKGIFGAWMDWLVGLKDIFLNAGSGLIDAFWAGIQAAWSTLKEGFTNLLEGLRSLLPFSDAEEGPLSSLTKSGRSLLPTFARGIEQGADEPVEAVNTSLAKIQLGAPSIPPLEVEPTANRQGMLDGSTASDTPSIVFQRGAFLITVSGADSIDDLEERLTEIFGRLALRLGVSYA
jgi:TP901 family phage tail tape measure protein